MKKKNGRGGAGVKGRIFTKIYFLNFSYSFYLQDKYKKNLLDRNNNLDHG